MIWLVIRVIASLAFIVGMLLLLARWSGRRFTSGKDAPLRVVARQALSRGSAIAVVEAGTRILVVGLTDQRVELLTELEPDEVFDDVVVGEQAAADAQVAPEGAGRHLRSPVRGSNGADGADGADGSGRAVGAEPGPLAGSVLSIETWRQAVAATKRAGGTRAS